MVKKDPFKFKPKDIIALVTIIGAIILFGLGYNGWIQGIMAFILSYYFVKRSNGSDGGK